MRALDKKLLREVWGIKGQALAIAMVIAGGVATFIMSTSTLDSLRSTRAAYYASHRFADVFVSLKRAPENVAARLPEIPGVNTLQTRVVAPALLDIPGYSQPVTGRILSLPDHGEALLNQLFLRRGRTIEAGREDEVILSEAFANAHGLQVGGHIGALIYGKRKVLRIVGIALSPEYIYQLEPGAIVPDFKGFGVLWMARKPLANASGMEGAFNDAAFAVAAGANREDVIDRVDDILRRYGGLGAISREDQVSHRYLSEEFKQLENMATIFPAIFLGVAAFLLNVVVSRLIDTQREQVAILKAFGYSNVAIVGHYTKFVAVIVAVGVGLGVALGAWLGHGLSRIYMEYYRFPFLVYRLESEPMITAALVSLAAAVLGTIFATVRAARLPPAEAMRPPAPARYRLSVVERLGLRRLLAQPTRMIVRNLERRPVKAFLSVAGIALACAILMMGRFFADAMDYVANIQFRVAQREDLAVTFVEPTSWGALHSLAALRGVEWTEPFRSVPARLRFEHRSYRTAIQGLPADAHLRLLLDRKLEVVELPLQGVLLTDYLAQTLGVQPGQTLTVEALEGERPVLSVPVAGVVKEYVGMGGYMRLDALNRLMGEGRAISGAWLMTDAGLRQAVYDELKELPRVAGVSVRENTLRGFYETMAEFMLTFAFFNTLLAGTIAFGVVYNSARIAFSERSRELASLRVLGFTRGEISYILLGELGVLTLLAIPAGFVMGRALCAYMIYTLPSDLYRIPLVISPSTYSFSATVVLVSAVLSALIIRRKLHRLDLVAVLKTRE